MPSETHLLSLDCEEYFSSTVPCDRWDQLPPRIEWATHHVLDLLDTYAAKATFFIVGWIAEKHPRLIREIAARGHDLGCHSYTHQMLFSMTPSHFRQDTRRARTAIEQASGRNVIGYRAPLFSITPQTAWALQVLSEEGFLYDSSIFPVFHDVYGWRGAERQAHVLSTPTGPLWEFPPATFRVFRTWILPVGGGGYLRMLPFAYTKFGLHRSRAEGQFLLYLHPWELDVAQPRIPSRWTDHLRHYARLGTTEGKFRRLLSTYRFDSIDALFRKVHPLASAGAVQ